MTPSPDHADELLVEGLAQSNKSAFETIYRKYARELYRYARKNIYNKEECEEIIQELFESLWAQRASMQIRTNLRAYLQGILRYKIIHYLRKNAVRKKHEEHFALFEAVYKQTEGDELNTAALQSTLDKLMKELPERCQTALKLRLSEQLSNQDIAKRMNITTRTVETYIYRAFNHIRSYYKTYAGKT